MEEPFLKCTCGSVEIKTAKPIKEGAIWIYKTKCQKCGEQDSFGCDEENKKIFESTVEFKKSKPKMRDIW